MSNIPLFIFFFQFCFHMPDCPYFCGDGTPPDRDILSSPLFPDGRLLEAAGRGPTYSHKCFSVNTTEILVLPLFRKVAFAISFFQCEYFLPEVIVPSRNKVRKRQGWRPHYNKLHPTEYLT